MSTFLFWNIHRNEGIKNTVVALAHHYNADVLMLAECPPSFKTAGLLPALNTRRGDEYSFSPASRGGYRNIAIYTRYAAQVTALEKMDGNRYTVRKIELLGDKPPVLLVAAHLPAKTNRSTWKQMADAKELASGIARAEQSTNIFRTVLVGDLNADPFEPGLIFAECLHSVMTRRLAQGAAVRQSNDSNVERHHRRFYNPMWRHYGELNNGPAGSYYGTFHYDKRSGENLYWHMLDQVLLRSELLPIFDDGSLEIVTRVKGTVLLNASGVPDKENYSDHLPILFELNI